MEVQGFEGTGLQGTWVKLGVQGIWFRSYMVPGFESTGYIVSMVPGYRVCSFSLLVTRFTGLQHAMLCVTFHC